MAIANTQEEEEEKGQEERMKNTEEDNDNDELFHNNNKNNFVKDGEQEEEQELPLVDTTTRPFPTTKTTTTGRMHQHYNKTRQSFRTLCGNNKGNCRFFFLLLFRFLLDGMLLLILLSFAILSQWTNHVYWQYMEPQYQSMLWTEERMESEFTYYARECGGHGNNNDDHDDITTFNPIQDLVLNIHDTTNKAYETQLRHGFTVFPNVLSSSSSSSNDNDNNNKNNKNINNMLTE